MPYPIFFIETVTCFYLSISRTILIFFELPEYSEFRLYLRRRKIQTIHKKNQQFFFLFKCQNFNLELNFHLQDYLLLFLDYLLVNWKCKFHHFNNLIYVNIYGIKVSALQLTQTNEKKLFFVL